jgi:hypothetical protein
MFEDENKKDPEEKKDPNEETTNLSQDKIFNNNYEATSYQGPDTNFTLSSQYNQGKDFIDSLEYDMSYEVIMDVLENSPYEKFNKPDAEGVYKKLNKMQINEVYSYVAMKLPNFPRVQMFSIVQDHFDINSNKFYDSLSNTFKKELIEELRNSGNIREKTGGPLF